MIVYYVLVTFYGQIGGEGEYIIVVLFWPVVVTLTHLVCCLGPVVNERVGSVPNDG